MIAFQITISRSNHPFFRLTVLLSVGGEPLTLPGDLPGDNLALKFPRGGVSDPRFSCVGGASCPLHYSAVRDNGCGSRTGWIRPHPLHFRPSCQERGGKGLIAALSDALFLAPRTMRAFQGSRSRGGWNPLHCLARGSRACGALRAGASLSGPDWMLCRDRAKLVSPWTPRPFQTPSFQGPWKFSPLT